MSEVDTTEILRALEAGQNTLAYLSSRPVQELDDNIKTKIHSTALSYQVFQSRIFNSKSSELDKVWEGLAMLEYMFGKYIKHYNDIDQLGCTICKDMFPCNQTALREHVESGIHVRKYSNIVLNDLNEYWKDESAMLKYGKFVDFNGPNGKIFCKVCCTEVENDKLDVLKHFKEDRHQKSFENIVRVITGSSCGDENDFLFSSSSQKNQFNPGHSSPSSGSQSSASSTSDSRPATRKSFTRKLVDARLSENVQKAGVENLNNADAASHTENTPPKQNNFTKSLVKDNQVMNTEEGNPLQNPDSRRKIKMKKICVFDLPKKDILKALEKNTAKFHESLRKSWKLSDTESSNDDSRNQRNKKILFDNIRKMSDVQRMHFMVCSIRDTNLIIPIGLEGVPPQIANEDIERACEHLGDVVRIERQKTVENVIVYIVLSDRYKNSFGKGLEVKIRRVQYKILNPFLYC